MSRHQIISKSVVQKSTSSFHICMDFWNLFPFIIKPLSSYRISYYGIVNDDCLTVSGSGICAFDQLGKAITHFARGIVNDCVLNSLHSSIILLTTFFTTFGVEEPANCLAIKCSIYRTEACAFVGCKFDASYQSFVAGSSWQIPKICVEMLLGMNETLKRALYLDNIDAFDYIYRSTTTRSFDECIKCFLSLGFSQEELDDIFKVLAICIHLETARRAAKGQNITETLDYASNLMGVPKSILISSFDSHLNISEWIFHSTLKWVLSKLDRKLSPPRSSRHWLNIWTPSSSIMSEDQNVAIKEAESFYKKLMLPVMENTFLFNILKGTRIYACISTFI